MVAAAFAVGLGAGRYVASAKSSSDAEDPASQPTATSAVIFKVPVTMSQAVKGPEDALVTFIEWCDLPDPKCKESDAVLMPFLAAHSKDARLVFRHYAQPDNTRLHQFTRAVFEAGGSKFWDARDLVQQHKGALSDADLERITGQLGMDYAGLDRNTRAGTYAGHIAADRVFAKMFEVKDTPAIFANGRRLSNPITKASLEQIFREESARANKALASGVQRKDLYTDLTKNGTWVKPPRELTGAKQ
jgi:protein-disulfide isomerase